MKNIITKLFPEKRLIMLIPYFIGAALFIILPTVMLFIKALTPVAGVESGVILKQEATWKIIMRSVSLGLIAALFSLVIAFPYAWIISRSTSQTMKVFSLSLLITPLLIFSIAKIFALRVTLIRIYDYQPNNIKEEWIMVLGMIYMYMPFMVIPLYSVLNNMPSSLIEASNDLGYGHIKTIFKVIIPYSLKAIFSGIAIVFMLSSTSLVISHTLVNDKTKMLIGNEIDTYSANMQNGVDVANLNGSTLALVTIAVVMGIYALIYLIPWVFRKIRGGVNV